MSVGLSRVSMLPATTTAEEPTFARVGWRALLVIELATLLAAIGLLWVLRQQAPQAVADAWRFVDIGWLLIATAGALGGALAAWLALRAHRAAQQTLAVACAALAVMAGCATLAVTVIETVGLYRYPQAMHQPHVVTISPPRAPRDVSAAPAAAPTAAQPDAAHGEKLFGASCAACHGAAGQGVDGIAPPVAGTDWLQQRSDAEVVAFLQVGRAPGDADSVMGRAMPARGGNVALTDGDLADIVAFMRSLEAGDVNAATAAPATVTPPRWLLAPGEPVADGLVCTGQRVPAWPREIAGVEHVTFAETDRVFAANCLAALNGVRLVQAIALMAVMLPWLARAGAGVSAARGMVAGWAVLLAMHLAVLAAQAAMT